YRLNQVPDRHRRKFLGLVGFAPLPPRASRGFLAFEPDPGTLPFGVPMGAVFDAAAPDGHLLAFRTLRDLTVVRVALTALQVEEGEPSTLRDRTAEHRDGLGIVALGAGPAPATALYLGFEEIPLGEAIALAVRVEGPGQDAEARARLLAERLLDAEACRPVLPPIQCDPAAPAAPTMAETLPHHSARLVWEVSTGPGPADWTALSPVVGMGRPQPGEVLDDTRALTLDGLVELSLPPTAAPRALGTVATPLVYVRARRVRGQHDAPVVLRSVAPNAVAVEGAVPAWQRFVIAAGVVPGGSAPAPGTATRLRFVLDARDVIQQLSFESPGAGDPDVAVLAYTAPTPATAGALTLELVLAGRGTGHPQRVSPLPGAPVVAESVELYAHDGLTWQSWTLRPDLDASTRADAHAALEAQDGQLELGDGERGRVVPADALLLARYRWTYGEAGNLAAATPLVPSAPPRNTPWLDVLPSSVVDQLSRIGRLSGAATGGTAAETVPSAAARAVRAVHAADQLVAAAGAARQDSLDQVDGRTVRALAAPTRGINCLDLERLALDVPGTRVARARAWAGIHPAYSCLRAPGVVTVVIVPDQPGGEPTPSPELLQAVARYLDRRRLVCMRVEVVGPRYLGIRVHAQVVTRPLVNVTRVQAAVRAALEQFLDPRTGGPEGRGWPFGRDVYRTEILELIDRVPGVDHVLELALGAEEDADPHCGNVRLCPTWLARAGTLRIDVNPRPGEGGTGLIAPCAPGPVG
ncbi:MAG TPA: baseplate J/gp47 family protein, partial [Pseudonocardia sp.]|nr:baseplate J/gp47 family protein [Pseudonocardia sp.]